jgi:hypothetical protein
MDGRKEKQGKKKKTFKQEKSRSKNLKKEKKRIIAKELRATSLSHYALRTEEDIVDISEKHLQDPAPSAAPCR